MTFSSQEFTRLFQNYEYLQFYLHRSRISSITGSELNYKAVSQLHVLKTATRPCNPPHGYNRILLFFGLRHREESHLTRGQVEKSCDTFGDDGGPSCNTADRRRSCDGGTGFCHLAQGFVFSVADHRRPMDAGVIIHPPHAAGNDAMFCHKYD